MENIGEEVGENGEGERWKEGGREKREREGGRKGWKDRERRKYCKGQPLSSQSPLSSHFVCDLILMCSSFLL